MVSEVRSDSGGDAIPGQDQYAHLAIFYDVGGVVPSFVLDPQVIYCIGSEEPDEAARREIAGASGKHVDFILLKGRSIAPNQLQIAAGDSGWLVTRYGTTPVWLDDEELEVVQSHRVDGESVIKVPGATLTLRTMAADGAQLATDENAEWRNAQDQLHKMVLDEYRAQAGSDAAERSKTNEEMRRDPRFVGILAQMAQDLVERLPAHTIESAVSWATRKFLVAKVAGASRASQAVDNIPSQFIAQQLLLFGTRTATELGLSLERGNVNADLEIVRRDLKTHLARALSNLPRGDQLEIAKAFLCGNIWDFIFNLGPVTDLMKLDVVTEIMVVRHDRIFLERSGKLEPYGYAFTDRQQLETLTRRIANEAQRELSASNAMADFRLKDGSRVNVITSPLSVNGPCITIRKHRGEVNWTLDELVRSGSLSQSMAWFLQCCVKARKNIVISGGTGTGKTTLLNALSAYIQADQRVVTIEDTAELVLEHEHVVTLQGRPANTEGRNEVSIRMLVRNALRMRPDRIIVGECRGGEAVDMLQALNTGHAGSMTTAHANSPEDMLLRMEVMVLQGEPNLPSHAIRQQIASAIDVVVQINRTEGKRRITAISEVIAYDARTSELIVEPVFTYSAKSAENGRYLFTGRLPTFVDELFHHLPMQAEQGEHRPVKPHEVFL